MPKRFYFKFIPLISNNLQVAEYVLEIYQLLRILRIDMQLIFLVTTTQ